MIAWLIHKEVYKETVGTKQGYYLISSYCPTLSEGEVLYSYHQTVALMKRYFVLITQDLS